MASEETVTPDPAEGEDSSSSLFIRQQTSQTTDTITFVDTSTGERVCTKSVDPSSQSGLVEDSVWALMEDGAPIICGNEDKYCM